jgi:hypothetical protein
MKNISKYTLERIKRECSEAENCHKANIPDFEKDNSCPIFKNAIECINCFGNIYPENWEL